MRGALPALPNTRWWRRAYTHIQVYKHNLFLSQNYSSKDVPLEFVSLQRTSGFSCGGLETVAFSKHFTYLVYSARCFSLSSFWSEEWIARFWSASNPTSWDRFRGLRKFTATESDTSWRESDSANLTGISWNFYMVRNLSTTYLYFLFRSLILLLSLRCVYWFLVSVDLLCYSN
jgi:hypothetical protein